MSHGLGLTGTRDKLRSGKARVADDPSKIAAVIFSPGCAGCSRGWECTKTIR